MNEPAAPRLTAGAFSFVLDVDTYSACLIGRVQRPLCRHGSAKAGVLAIGDGVTTRLMQRSKNDRYSITWSARASSVEGTVRPSAFAVLRLIRSSNFVGCSTGRSAGFTPFRILSTNAPARRYKAGTFGP